VPPFFENLGKRLIKSLNLFFCDSGLICHLLYQNRYTAQSLAVSRSQWLRAPEIAKPQLPAGRRREFDSFRHRPGLPVDFVVPDGGRGLSLIESKASRSVTPAAAEPVRKLAWAADYQTRSFVADRPAGGEPDVSALL
jgi:predicted AAA+ superfamily ATPase